MTDQIKLPAGATVQHDFVDQQGRHHLVVKVEVPNRAAVYVNYWRDETNVERAARQDAKRAAQGAANKEAAIRDLAYRQYNTDPAGGE